VLLLVIAAIFGSLFLSLFINAQFGKLIPTSGSSLENESSKTLAYRTDFESAVRSGDTVSSIGFSPQFWFEGSGGASMWVEGVDRKTAGIEPHSGSRCIGLEVTNISQSRRVEAVIQSSDMANWGAKDEFYISEWRLLPTNWQLVANGWDGLFQVSDANLPNWWPYYQLLLIPGSGITINIVCDHRDVNGVYSYVTSPTATTIVRGQWYHLEVYMVRDSNAGIIKAWINGRVVVDLNKINTKTSDNYHIEMAKVYTDSGETLPKYDWLDDLQVWNGIPRA
jgi:hypothetical protein